MAKSWQKWLGATAIAAAVGTVGVLGGAAVVYQAATKSFSRNRRKTKQRAIAENTAADNAWYLRHNPVEWTQTSLDGLILRASCIEATQPTKKVAILAHGLGHAREQMIPWAKTFHDWGYTVLMPDARAHGDSEGHTIGYGWPDRFDYNGWINQVIATYGEDCEIVLLGISMGAATVLATAGEDLPHNVKAVVADSGYASVLAEARYRIRNKYHLPVYPILPIADQYSRLAEGYRLSDGNIAQQLQKTHLPILFIQGANDETVPVENLDVLYRAAAGPKERYRDNEAGHIATRAKDPAKYDDLVKTFLEKYVD
ncbi:alpha/beta hydrolase [Levilactobacillus humaensis]|uniref:alpha/beta hydrolase n=1 Tax=Levilactobacillus humaensis TaxID=2950375 RepID=UPI0021C47086|nr:alpha/beta hydrolase [Levilactobacillus humaensis]